MTSVRVSLWAQIKQLELAGAEELERALEEADAERDEAVLEAAEAARATAKAEFLSAHGAEMERAAAALAELAELKLKTGELEKTITRLTPRGGGSDE